MEFPALTSGCPIKFETTELTISGRSVPNETSTKPIINCDIPNIEAQKIECSTALSLAKVIRIIPAMRINNQMTGPNIP
jgi:hypothetical protein